MQKQSQDSDIIRQVLAGQQQAFAILVERYQHFVFTITLRFVDNREEAEELAQDVFVKAYRSLSHFRGESKFSTWLYTITHNTCRSHKRKKKEAIVTLEEHHEQVAAPEDRKHSKNMIQQAIKQLPETDAQIITLFYLAEQSIEETGQILGLSQSNVKVRLFRARQKLKEILEAEYKEELKHL